MAFSGNRCKSTCHLASLKGAKKKSFVATDPRSVARRDTCRGCYVNKSLSVLVKVEEPGVVLCLSCHHGQNVCGREPREKDGIIVSDRFARHDLLDLAAFVGLYHYIGVDVPEGRAGDLGIDARLIVPLFVGCIHEHGPADHCAQSIGGKRYHHEGQGDFGNERPFPGRDPCKTTAQERDPCYRPGFRPGYVRLTRLVNHSPDAAFAVIKYLVDLVRSNLRLDLSDF
ncbi:hypothetical protein ACQKP1_12740 [Allorhizobium sp. NPDC080224]|uniref:hypothetical protein n=1 Tax=Allorhizobium sp. NPDC080224 TaxID=3390547 RepID=UPI003D044933